MLAAMNAMTDVQLHRYNAATVDSVKNNFNTWAAQMSTPEHPVTFYFIEVNFEEVPQLELKLLLNQIPTSFSLSNEEVDTLLSSARSLLRADPEFQRLLTDLAGPKYGNHPERRRPLPQAGPVLKEESKVDSEDQEGRIESVRTDHIAPKQPAP